MKTTLALAALALATGCAGTDDRKDVVPTAAESRPRFADHEGRPSGRGAAHAGSAADDDPWWSSALGDFLGGCISLLFAKDRGDKPDDTAEAPFKPWPVDTGNL